VCFSLPLLDCRGAFFSLRDSFRAPPQSLACSAITGADSKPAAQLCKAPMAVHFGLLDRTTSPVEAIAGTGGFLRLVDRSFHLPPSESTATSLVFPVSLPVQSTPLIFRVSTRESLLSTSSSLPSECDLQHGYLFIPWFRSATFAHDTNSKSADRA
jgi:hypothetical protein